MSGKNKEIVEKVNAAFAGGKPEEFLSFCSEDVEWRMVGGKNLNGKNAIRVFMSQCESADMELPHFSVDELIAEGDSVVAYGDMTMKEKGEEVFYSYVDVYRFKNEKIVQLQSFIVKHKTDAENEQKAAA